MQSKKRLRWPFALLAIISLGVALLFVFGKYEFVMSESEIQKIISDALPMEHSGVTMTDVDVDLSKAQGSVILKASGEATRLGRTFAFTLQTEGVPDYKFTSGSFYFRATSVEILSLEQTKGETTGETVDRVGTFVRGLFPKREDTIDEMQYAAAKLAPGVQSWIEDHAEGAVTYVLQRVPIYTLPSDVKGVAAQAVLDEVRIENKSLVIKLSLYRLGSWVIIFILVALVSIGLMLSPLGLLLAGIGGIIG